MASAPHLAHSRILLTQAHDDDAVSLADAALCPGGQVDITLVQDNAVEVLLLTQPAGQAVLVNAADQGYSQQGRAARKGAGPRDKAHLSRAAAPSRCLMISLVRRRVGPEKTT